MSFFIDKLISQRFRSRIATSTLARRLLTLAVGAAAGQAILVAVSPLLTRLYTPTDFGVFGTFTAVLTVVALVGSLRYEMAIPLASTPQRARELVVVSLITLGIVTGVVSAVLVVIQVNRPIPALADLAWLLPVGVLAGGCYNVFSHWALRLESYRPLARTRSNQAIAAAGVQTVGGIVFPSALMLAIGDVVGRAGGSSVLIREAFRDFRNAGFRVSAAALRAAAWDARSFPLVTTGSTLLNALGLQLPIILIAALWGSTTAGWFSLATRAVGVPMYVVAGATAQVYLGEAGRIRAAGQSIRPLFFRTIRQLTVVGLVPGLIALFFGDSLFAAVFGEAWRVSGDYVQLLSIGFVLQLVISPVSQTLTILGRQGLQAAWDAGRLALITVSFVIPHQVGASAATSVAVYGGVMIVSYLALLLLSIFALRSEAAPETIVGQAGPESSASEPAVGATG